MQRRATALACRNSKGFITFESRVVSAACLSFPGGARVGQLPTVVTGNQTLPVRISSQWLNCEARRFID